jgi:hypothetical protein
MAEIWTPSLYQKHMVQFGTEVENVALWADMGLGKSVTAATIAQRCLYDSFCVRRVLIVAPKRVASKAWPNEFRKWHHLQSMNWRVLRAEDFGLTPSFEEVDWFDPVLEMARKRLAQRGLVFGWDQDDPSGAQRQAKREAKKRLQSYREHVHIVSWDFLPWLVKAMGDNWPYEMVILDEASFVKNQDTVRFRALRHVRKFTRRVIELTGTPATRSLLDVWAPLFLLDEGKRLGATYGNFRDAYFTPDKRGRDGVIYSYKIDPDGRERIYRRIDDVCMSLSADDWLSLPPLVENPIYVELPPHARELYDKVEHDLIALLNGATVLAKNAAVLVSKLLQIANGAVFDDCGNWHSVHDAKLDALDELLEATSGGVLCAYAFKPDAERIQKRFGKIAVPLNTDKRIDDWNAGKVKLGYAHPGSLGYGMNDMQYGGSNSCWFGPTHNLEHWLQFNKRLHRDGQQADRVLVNLLLADNTLDDHVRYENIADKDTEEGALLAAVKARVESLDAVAA